MTGKNKILSAGLLISNIGITRVFSIISIAGILVVSSFLYLILQNYVENSFLQHQIKVNEILEKNLLQQIPSKHLAPLPDMTAKNAITNAMLKLDMINSGISGVRIYGKDNTIIYATGETLQRPDWNHIENSRNGNQSNNVKLSQGLLLSYNPLVHPENKAITAVLEISYNLKPVQKKIQNFTNNLMIAVVSLQILLFLFLFGFFYFIENKLYKMNQILYDEQEEKIRYLAHFDTLTDLPNRNSFANQIEHAMAEAKKHNNTIAVILIGIDKFKMVNDSLGNETGDWLLVQIAKRLKKILPKDQYLFHIGGDQFAIILTHVQEEDIAPSVLDIQVGVFEEPFRILEKEIILTAGIGVAYYPGKFENSHELIQAAETALINAKQIGRNRFVVYTEAINEYARNNFEMEMKLRQALQLGEFQLYYQPKISSKDLNVNGMEALLRWNHPELGLIYPETFIPILEESGLIIPVGEWVIREACTQCKKWHDEGQTNLKISLNLSFKQFQSKDLASYIQNTIVETGLNPSYIEFELTESILAEDHVTATKTLEKLKNLGVDISIDDFGTGYSSLSYLMNFPIDNIKIDRSFVRDINNNPEKASLTQSIILMAQNLKLGIIAEGIEDAKQMNFLSDKGCDELQGFHFSNAVPAEKFLRVVAEINQRIKKITT